MNEIIIPEIPSDNTLSTALTARPDWELVGLNLKELNGKELVNLGELGADTLQEVADIDTQVKRYEAEFLEYWWQSPYGMVEKAGKTFSEIRLSEVRRCTTTRNSCRIIQHQAQIERERLCELARAEEQRKLREQAERDRLAQLAQLEAERAVLAEVNGDGEPVAELTAQIEEVKAAPVTPVVVSDKQALASAGLSAAPKGIIAGCRVWKRRIKHLGQFGDWLEAHPTIKQQCCKEQTDGSYRLTLVPLERSGIEIPGLEILGEDRKGGGNRRAGGM